MIEEYLLIALEAAINAGSEIMKIYESDNFEIEVKEDASPLTKADKTAHQIITKYLSKTGLPILSEEGKHIPFEDRNSWGKFWMVDPIDGTKEFIKRNGEFTINIALIYQQKPILGVVYAPALHELYYAQNTLGAFKINTTLNIDLNNILSDSIKLPVSKTNNIYTIVASRSHLSKETTDFIEQLKNDYDEIEMISRGSSLKFCLVAEGAADCYPRFAPTMEWDTAAGHAICKFAGFTILDLTTKAELLYNKENLLNNFFLVEKSTNK
jgi:3'(2'), 5'-bisphosphate nucleotidase